LSLERSKAAVVAAALSAKVKLRSQSKSSRSSSGSDSSGSSSDSSESSYSSSSSSREPSPKGIFLFPVFVPLLKLHSSGEKSHCMSFSKFMPFLFLSFFLHCISA
jgi:hypothetical protein